MMNPASDPNGGARQLRFLRVHINEQPYWEYVTRTNSAEGVTIVAVTCDQEILVVRQHRIPLGAKVIELPAGLVGDHDQDETPEEAVAKELREETGYEVKPADIRLLAKGPALAGLTNEINGLYLATDARQVSAGGGMAAEGECIETYALPLASVMDALQQFASEGCQVDLKVYAGLHFLRHAQRGLDDTTL
jgi:ADP-ribose pyrophosphatase